MRSKGRGKRQGPRPSSGKRYGTVRAPRTMPSLRPNKIF